MSTVFEEKDENMDKDIRSAMVCHIKDLSRRVSFLYPKLISNEYKIKVSVYGIFVITSWACTNCKFIWVGDGFCRNDYPQGPYSVFPWNHIDIQIWQDLVAWSSMT